MTYRERRLAKAARLRGWAAKRQADADATLKSHEPFTQDHAFNTQPGHIPLRARIIAQEDRAFASLNKAAAMNARAAGIEYAADRAIYSDDEDAIGRLREKIAGLQTRQDRMKAINKEIRKGDGWLDRIDPPLTDGEKQDLLNAAKYSGTVGYPAYATTNNGGNIRRLQKRLEALERAEKELA